MNGEIASGCLNLGLVTITILENLILIPPGATKVPSLTVENYVKGIYFLAAADGGPITEVVVSTGEISREMGVSPGSVTGMLKSLTEDGLTTYTPYEGVRLTEEGRRLALKVIRRHRLLETFLVEVLQMPWDEVHEEAEILEHAVSDRLIDRMDNYLGTPDVDPHGDPIPKADGTLPAAKGQPLKELQGGVKFRVVRVSDQDSAFLRYLTESGIVLGATGKVLENRREAGAILFEVAGKNLILGHEAASNVQVVIIK
jgi:DtxR family Mn-dependent transcriptional regulator